MRIPWARVLVLAASAALLAATPARAQTGFAAGAIAGRVLDRDTGLPLNFANVVILGTTLGANARNGGAFTIASVPVGTYKVKATFVGYDSQTLTEVGVNAGVTTTIELRLKRSYALTVETITVLGKPRQIDVRDSDVAHVQTDKDVLSLPVESVAEALALNTGVVVQGGELHVRGGRSTETSVRIDGVPVNDPLSNGNLDIGMLTLAQQKIITGGMNAEYGNASSAVIEYTTKSGGRNFEGHALYMTDDYGRSDKTFTNYDRLSLGLGGPAPFRDLTYYVSGEATFQDGDVLSVRDYEERKYLGGLIKVTDRAAKEFRAQGRLDWKTTARIKMSAEMTLDYSDSDPYLHNWNTEGEVAQTMRFVEARVNRFQQRHFTPQGTVVMYQGPWYERALRATYIDWRLDQDCLYCLLPVADNQSVRAVRVVDAQGRGADPTRPPVYALIDFVVFQGWQNPLSRWAPELGTSPGDSNKTHYNAAEHVGSIHNRSRQIKWALTHTLSPRTFYEVKLSRLSIDVLGTVDGKTPGEFATAGKFLWIPGQGPQRIGNVDFYTDPDVPFFVTAYDFPAYLRRNTETYFMRSDITTQRWRNHKIKGGCILQYNDLDQASFGNPGLQRQYRDPFGYSRNAFHNFNPEGSLYVQDQWEHEGMVVNAGLRFDFFSPGSGVGIEINSTGIQRHVERWQSQWSPRLGLAFPITDRDVFHFHYGRFIQFAEKRYIFASQDLVAGASGFLGNPNLEPETSVAYQAGIKHQFTHTLSGQFAIFNKDYYGLVTSIEITDDSTGTQGLRYVNRAYASSRGVELQLNKSLSRHVALDVAYTYSFADGVASSAEFGREAQGLTHLPTGELPLNWDQRHTFNATLAVARAGDWVVTTVYKYFSGLPWTPYFRFAKKQDPLLENSRRFPATHFLDVQGEKYFRIWNRSLRLFFQGRNLLDEDEILEPEPGITPSPRNATDGYMAYATETGRFGGAYLYDSDGDGQDEFFPVNDPRVFGQRRLFRVGLGFEF